jgi:hypothetical protein
MSERHEKVDQYVSRSLNIFTLHYTQEYTDNLDVAKRENDAVPVRQTEHIDRVSEEYIWDNFAAMERQERGSNSKHSSSGREMDEGGRGSSTSSSRVGAGRRGALHCHLIISSQSQSRRDSKL